uniref:Uncharacterized protein n=1 Tax=Romanomermis culicivorax TaxID=13658 RepID=A0A915IQL6_ROMCU
MVPVLSEAINVALPKVSVMEKSFTKIISRCKRRPTRRARLKIILTEIGSPSGKTATVIAIQLVSITAILRSVGWGDRDTGSLSPVKDDFSILASLTSKILEREKIITYEEESEKKTRRDAKNSLTWELESNKY